MPIDHSASRRRFLTTAVAAAGAATVASSFPAPFVRAAAAPLRVGVLLPFSGTFALLGEQTLDGMKLRVDEAGGNIAGRPVQWVVVDSEASVPKAEANISRLLDREKVDLLVGPVHSGVATIMASILRDRGAPVLIVPNAGSNAVTRELCARNIFRTSFTNWQPSYPAGRLMAEDGRKTAVLLAWKYAAGEEAIQAGRQGFEELGGTIVHEMYVPFPNVEFQPYLTEVASIRPDAVFAFFGGAGAAKFVMDYAAAGLRESVPLYGPGFLTEGVVQAQGSANEGLRTTMHYSDDLDFPANTRFRAAFKDMTGREADLFAVQGYDTTHLMEVGLQASQGDAAAIQDVAAAMAQAQFDSPRGPVRFSKANHIVQNIYLRTVQGGRYKTLGVAAEMLEDPTDACRMSA